MRHHTYVKGRPTCTIREEKGRKNKIEGASHFRDLKMNIKKLSRKERTTLAPWILEITWNLADQRTVLGRKIRANQGEQRLLTQRFQATLKEDR